MIPIFKSRYTPNLENGENVKFNIGEVNSMKNVGEMVDIILSRV